MKKIWHLVKVLFKARSGYKKIRRTYMKEGWKTTEFFLTVLGVVATIWTSVQGMIPAELTVKIITVSIGLYTIARGIAKITPTQKDDEIIKRIEEIFKIKPN